MLGLDIKLIKLDLVLLKKQLELLSLKYGPFEEKFLNLCDNKFGNEGVRHICEGIKQNRTLQLIYINNNNLRIVK